MIRLRVKEGPGNHVVVKKMTRSWLRSEATLRQFWLTMGQDLKFTAEQEIQFGLKSGEERMVRSRTGRRRHRASAPGQTHADVSEDTRESLSFMVMGRTGLTFGYGAQGEEGSRAGEYLEHGTVKMDPRPTLKNAITVVGVRAQAHFDAATRMKM